MRYSVVVAVVIALFVSLGSNAQPLADRVPGDALIYAGWSGSESMGAGYDASHLKAVLDESKFSELVNRSIPNLLKKIGASDRDAAEITGLISAIGGPVWRHPTAFYFGGLDTSDPNAPPTPKLAILCMAGGESTALVAQLRKVLANAQAPFEIKVEERGGAVLLATGNKGWGAGQAPANALKANAKFQSALAQVGKDPVAAIYLDVEGMVKLADGLLLNQPPGQTWASVRDALGLPGIKRVIVASGFDGKDWSDHAYVEAPAPRVGALPAMLDAKPLSNEIIKTIPQTATVAMAGKLDLGGIVANIRTGAAKVSPEAGKSVEDAFAQLKQMLGLDVQTDLLNHLGDEWSLYVDPMTAGNGMLGFCLVNRPRNAQKVDAALTWLEDLANKTIASNTPPDGPTFAFKRSKTGDLTLHYFPVPAVSPTWAVKDGNLYAGLYPQVVQAAAEQGSGKGKSLLDNEDFLAVRKRLGNQSTITGFTFANLPKTAPEGYQEMLMVMRLYLGFADLFGADTPAMLMPPLRKIMPHLSPAGSVSWVDASGWHSQGITPFPGATMFTPGGGGQVLIGQQALLVSILLPSLNRARETANRVKCGSNERQIGMAILLYSNENRGKYPPDLGSLVKTQEISPQVFVCPSGDTPPPPPFANLDEAAKWVNEHSDYIYVGAGMNSSVGAEVIVLYEKPDDHGKQGINMLYGDGHVEWNQMSDAMRLIEKQKALRKGGAQ
jgi:prepilin-type processing-associated H-X9-DG protein